MAFSRKRQIQAIIAIEAGQIENIMYIIDKLGLTQLYLGTYVHYIKNGFQPYFRAFLCL